EAAVGLGETLGKIAPRKLPPGEASAGADEYDRRPDEPCPEVRVSLGTGSSPGRGRRGGRRNTLRDLLLDGRLLEGLGLWVLRLRAHGCLPSLAHRASRRFFPIWPQPRPARCASRRRPRGPSVGPPRASTRTKRDGLTLGGTESPVSGWSRCCSQLGRA